MASSMLTAISFGTLVPLLLILAPATSLLNLRAIEWATQHSPPRQFGEVVAERVLVQTPVFTFRRLGCCLNLVVMVFVTLDLVTTQHPVIDQLTVQLLFAGVWHLADQFLWCECRGQLMHCTMVGSPVATLCSTSYIFQPYCPAIDSILPSPQIMPGIRHCVF